MLTTIRQHAGVSAVACFTVVSALALACCAFAGTRSVSAATQPAPGDARGADAKPPKPSEAAKDGGRSAKPDRRKTASEKPVSKRQPKKRAKKRPAKRPDTAARGPQSRWVCDAKTVTLKPLWTGEPVKATWVIRNEGDADLTIKLRGG